MASSSKQPSHPRAAGEDAAGERAQRLAAALRANLRRRKAAPEGGAASPPPAKDAGDA